ncbi:MAG TPA: hypothetical protein VKU36_05665 [Candidatus Babeliales bacterium]|nr:hypothetical protein [Candidatus Babeliales bacterium]
MKKTTMVLTVLTVVSTNSAFPGSQLIQQDTLQYQKKNKFLDAANEYERPMDEYEGPADQYQNALRDEYNNTQQALEEYDQHVSDNAQSPKVSDLRALLTEICGFILVRYLTIRNTLCAYGSEIKDRINTWMNA